MIKIIKDFLNYSGFGLYYKAKPFKELPTAEGSQLLSINTPTDNILQANIEMYNTKSAEENNGS